MLRTMAIEIRTVTDDEVPAWRDAIFTTFGDDASGDPDGDARTRALIPEKQRWAAFDGPTVVATAATFDHAIGLPGGGTMPIAGLTMVSVRPTHRRKGLLRELMKLHLSDGAARGFAVGGLWATEAVIYGRFGFGIATHADVIAIQNAGSIVLRDDACDDFEWIDDVSARIQLPDIYARATALRPGILRRPEVWWRERRFLETPMKRAGASKRRTVLARRGGAVTGYLVFRQRPAWDGDRPNGKLEIVELIGCDARAELSLWRFALNADLFPNVSWWNAPVDDPLVWAVTDARQIIRKRTDSLWLRIEDVSRALAARTYSCDGTLRIAVDDATFELAIHDGRATCARTQHAPDVRLAAVTLGSLYLGGAPFSQLARAALVTGEASALVRADRMFSSTIAPWCPEVF